MNLFEVIMKFESGLRNILINDQTLQAYLGGEDFDTLEALMNTDTWDDVTDVMYPNYSGNHPRIEVKDDVMDSFDDFSKMDCEISLIGVSDGKLSITI